LAFGAEDSTQPPQAQETSNLRQQAEALLARVEATPAGAWRISSEEHAAIVSLAEAFSLELRRSAFRSSEEVAVFVRLALQAMRG
jgi:hypothetical protein